MEQITKTVNSFLASVVGVGLICFTTFILLLASAQLNNSLLGDLLARTAGETARTARTQSFAYWGRVGNEVASGLGVGQPLNAGAPVSPGFTPVPVIITQPPIVVTQPPTPSTPVPAPTQRPITYVLRTPLSNSALLMWRGLDANGQPLPFGVILNNVQQQAKFALDQNAGDLLALWILNRLKLCEPLYNQMTQADYRDPAQASKIISAANSLLQECNPRVYEAYARIRWANISTWLSQTPLDESRAGELLGGLKILIGSKLDGPARGVRPQDHVEVTIQAIPEMALAGVTFQLTVGTLNDVLQGTFDEGTWQLNSGPYEVPGLLFPTTAREPDIPTDDELNALKGTAAPSGAQAAEGGQGGTTTRPGTYVVQPGDTLYKIARQFNITPQALIDANRSKVGFNPDFITVGMELTIPGPP